MEQQISNFGGINTYVNPFNAPDGNVIHCVNLENFPYGGKRKRLGYSTFLGTPDTSPVNSLFSWTKNDGTTLFLYRYSYNQLYYSAQGTGAWTSCGTGAVGINGAHMQYAVLNDVLVISDGTAITSSSSNGTTFASISAAPYAVSLAEYQGRIYAAGTSSNLFYSTTGTATDWTTDSSSLLIPGAGKLSNIFKGSDRLVATKNSNTIYRYDGYSLVDLATKLGPSSPYSIGEVEDYRLYLNRLGLFITNADKPQLISNPIQRQIYNNDSTGINGATFGTAPAIVHNYDYLLSAGTLTDDFTKTQITNAIIKYDYQKNLFSNYKFANFPTAYHSYVDANGVRQLIFGDINGQCYKFGTQNSDNGTAIEASLMLILHGNAPHVVKEFESIEFYTNPGCGASVQFAIENTIVGTGQWYNSGPKVWRELGSLEAGYTYFRFPTEARGKLMWIKIYESSKDTPWSLYSINYKFRTTPSK